MLQQNSGFLKPYFNKTEPRLTVYNHRTVVLWRLTTSIPTVIYTVTGRCRVYTFPVVTLETVGMTGNCMRTKREDRGVPNDEPVKIMYLKITLQLFNRVFEQTLHECLKYNMMTQY